MKILIVSGFLGAGKTTFILNLAKATNREYVILENEFADINIDGDILRGAADPDGDAAPRLEVRELSDGCICCNMAGDFSATLVVIQNTLEPDFLIIEPSGVSVLTNILNNARGVEYEHIQLLPAVAVIDALTYWKYKRKYEDIFMDRVNGSGTIQLSKTELMDSDEVEKIVEDLQKINPEAKIYSTPYKDADEAYWDRLFEGELTGASIPEAAVATPDLQNMSFRGAKCGDLVDLMRFLNRLVLGMYGGVCRAKGVFETKTCDKLRFDLVDGLYSVTCAEAEDENDVVIIGEKLKTILLRSELRRMAGADIKIVTAEHEKATKKPALTAGWN